MSTDEKAWDPQQKLLIRDFRCNKCGWLLFRAHIPNVQGFYIEIRCKHRGCGTLNIFRPALPDPDAIRVDVVQDIEPNEEGNHDTDQPVASTIHVGAPKRAMVPITGVSG